MGAAHGPEPEAGGRGPQDAPRQRPVGAGETAWAVGGQYQIAWSAATANPKPANAQPMIPITIPAVA